jgi:hypothetical protein
MVALVLSGLQVVMLPLKRRENRAQNIGGASAHCINDWVKIFLWDVIGQKYRLC